MYKPAAGVIRCACGELIAHMAEQEDHARQETSDA